MKSIVLIGLLLLSFVRAVNAQNLLRPIETEDSVVWFWPDSLNGQTLYWSAGPDSIFVGPDTTYQNFFVLPNPLGNTLYGAKIEIPQLLLKDTAYFWTRLPDPEVRISVDGDSATITVNNVVNLGMAETAVQFTVIQPPKWSYYVYQSWHNTDNLRLRVNPGEYEIWIRLKNGQGAVQPDAEGKGYYGPWSFSITPTALIDELSWHITAYDLHQNYPNPFNPITTITFELPERLPVNLVIFTLEGKVVATLVNETLSAGRHSLVFNGSDLPSGTYFYKIQAGNFTKTKKMLLLK